MSTSTQTPTLWDKIKALTANAATQSYAMMAAGLKSTLPIPGITGYAFKTKHTDQRSTAKSKRIMRLERGHQPESIGDRRFIRYAARMRKQKNSFCNNISTIPALQDN